MRCYMYHNSNLTLYLLTVLVCYLLKKELNCNCSKEASCSPSILKIYPRFISNGPGFSGRLNEPWSDLVTWSTWGEIYGKWVLNGHFSLCIHFSYNLKQAIGLWAWKANPNHVHRHFPRKFWSSCEYLIHGQSEDSYIMEWSYRFSWSCQILHLEGLREIWACSSITVNACLFGACF